MEYVFWLCLFGACYSYLIYPVLLGLMPARPPGRRVSEFAPLVSIVIACRNEERRLREKILNTLATTYRNREIIVASDASDDQSDGIAASFESQGVRLVRSPERRGKEHAQQLAIAASSGEIVVFTDAGTDLAPQSIDELVDTFRDQTIGAVSSEDELIAADGSVVGEGAYVKYEMWLRQLESRRSGLVGLSGSFFAVRRSVLTRWDATIPSDFACALMTVQAGMFAVTNDKVRGRYRDVADPRKEYGRKVRTAIRGMTALLKEAKVLNPFSFGRFAFQVWSHKVMRWLVPWFLLGLFVSAAALAGSGWLYRLAFAGQLAGYAAVVAAHWLPLLRKHWLLRLGYYFVQVNIALAAALVLVLSGRRVVVWNPSTR